MGALTSTFLKSVKNATSNEDLLARCRDRIEKRGLKQIPQLSASQNAHNEFAAKGYLFESKIQSNTNKYFGIHTDQTTTPQTPTQPEGPLGNALVEAGFELLVSRFLNGDGDGAGGATNLMGLGMSLASKYFGGRN